MFDFLVEGLTHKELLMLLPFECGYACNDDGTPCAKSIMFALTLRTIDVMMNPAYSTRDEEN